MIYHPDFAVTDQFRPQVGGWKTLVKRASNGTTQRTSQYTAGRPQYDVVLDWLSPANCQVFADFVDSVKGGGSRFYWFSHRRTTRTGIAVGTGTGSTTVFTLPFKDANATTAPVFHWTGGGTATWSAKSATNGEDRVTFSVAPTNGTPITVDFTQARERLQVVFLTDAIPGNPRYQDGGIWYQWSYSLQEDF